MKIHKQSASNFLRELVANRVTDWPVADTISSDVFIDEVSKHAVGPLLYWLHAKKPSWKNWPKLIKDSLSNEAAQSALVAETYRREIGRVVELLASAGIATVLLKGIRLAYTLYPSPELRPYCDADLLIQESDFEDVLRILSENGYVESLPQMGSLIRFEHCLERSGPGNITFLLDIHWKLSSLQLLAEELTFESLRDHTHSIPEISQSAVGLDDHYTFIHACTHLLAQHRHSADLIWLYDIHLLLLEKDEAWYQSLDDIINETALAPFCAAAMFRTAKTLRTPVSQFYLEKWQSAVTKDAKIALAYLNSSGIWIDNIRADLSALPDLSTKTRYLMQHLLPPADFMLNKYQTKNRLILPLLYGHRIAQGAWKLCAPRG